MRRKTVNLTNRDTGVCFPLDPRPKQYGTQVEHSAHESVVKQCFQSGSSSKRAYSVQNSAPADEHDEPEVSEPEYRAVIAAALGDNFDETEDGRPDK